MGLLLLVAGIFTALPLVYSIINAFKPLNELFLYPPRFFVYHPTMDNFKDLMQATSEMLAPFERYVFNSLFTTVVGTVGYIFVACFAAYPLAKHKFPGRAVISNIVIFGILFRQEVTSIPQYVIIAKLGMINTYWSVLLPAMAGSFGIFLMKQFISSLPNDVLEAARIDGLGEILIFFRIVMPMTKPAWITLVIFTFQSMWNSTGVSFIYDESMKMLPTALQQISTAGFQQAGIGSAVACFMMLPPILIFILCQNSVLETMAYSGLKS
ncbi:MAG: carbohydrate ABC transporter permease [Clostridiales bacterium]|nr:carbohydrate ABC transporter permease [Clostridiales bacterium]